MEQVGKARQGKARREGKYCSADVSVCDVQRLYVLAYFPKMPANFVPHFLMIQASSELIRPGTCLVYSWKELPAGFWRLNVTMTRDRIFSLKSALFFAGR
jgi:hypothetical protein